MRRSSHRLELPANLPPGRYDLLVSLYTLDGDQPATVSSTVLEDFVPICTSHLPADAGRFAQLRW